MQNRSDVLRKRVIGIAVVLAVGIFSGCSDSKLEDKNRQLEDNLVQMKVSNAQLRVAFNNAQYKISKYERELSSLRDNNKDLNVSLAKSELVFAKKHQEELAEERKKLEESRAAMEEAAYNDVSNRFAGIFIAFLILFVSSLLGWLMMWSKNKKDAAKRAKEIKDLTDDKTLLQEEKDELEKKMIDFNHKIEELKRRQKEGMKNQVVNKIEAYQKNRERTMSRIEGALDGH